MNLSKKQLLSTVLILILVMLLPVTVFISQKKQEIRSKAQVPPSSSTLTLIGPNQVKVGEKFSVDVVLDTTNDPDYTIANADVVVSINSYNPHPSPSCPSPRACPTYDLPPTFCVGGQIVYPQPTDPCDCRPHPKCIMPGEEQGSSGQIGAPSSVSVSLETKPAQITKEEIKPREETLNNDNLKPWRWRPFTLLGITPGKLFDNYIYPGSPGLTCGGIAGLKCPDGYICSYGGNIKMDYPDQSGICVSKYDINPPPPVETGGTGSSSAGGSAVSATGMVVDMNKLPSPNPTTQCPPFPGCPPEGSLMPWNICWGDVSTRCPSSTYKKKSKGIIEGTGDTGCTQEAKQCPDGTWVGRTGPRCEFAPCPGEVVKPTATPNPSFYEKNQFTISGSKNFAVDEKGYFKGFTGKGTFATLNFVANYAGKVEIKLLYHGSNEKEPQSHVKGYLKNQNAKLQILQERLLSPPINLNIEVVGESKPTCSPRPPCLEGIGGPRCVLPEPPGGWCPKPSITSAPIITATSIAAPISCSRKRQGDANCDGNINGLDYSIWLNAQCHPAANQKCGDLRADFNGDGKVDDEDYQIWFNNGGSFKNH
jgi:hypothetical protein